MSRVIRQLRSFRETSSLRHDLPSSLVVFLIAIPLSLGIAAVSGAPLIAGLIAAVVGGVVVGAIGGAPLQVSGPAAGLTVIVAGLVQEYGWAVTAAITVAAGALQILLGVTKLGRAALSLSPAVVHGMLAGIGVVIALSQIHVVLGGSPQTSALSNLRDLPAQIVGHHDQALLVGATAIFILLLWPRIPKVSVIPAPLVAVLVAVAMASGLNLDVTRVDLPDDPLQAMIFPALPNGEWGGILIAIITVAVVASVESMLSAIALDRLHSGPRANLDRELTAQGIGNMVSGGLGGLPITGVVVRSATNVKAGAKTRLSTMMHGVWIAIFALFAVGVLELIPMAALAAILVVVGAALVNPGHIRTLKAHHELPVYVITVAGVVCLNLVEGVLLGVAAAIIRALYRLTRSDIEKFHVDPGHWKVMIHGSLIFVAVAKLIRELRSLPNGQRVTVELHVDFMDHAAFDAIHDWQLSYQRLGGEVDVVEVHEPWFKRARSGNPKPRKSIQNWPQRWFAPWSHWQTQLGHRQDETPVDNVVPLSRAGKLASSQGKPIPGAAMLVGMREFERRRAPLVRPFFTELAASQEPEELFITCADSRIVPNLITTSGPGDLFCIRNVGNLIPRFADDASVAAAVEFAVDGLGVTSLTVCGHSDCGAMKAVMGGGIDESSQLAKWLKHGEASLARWKSQHDNGSDKLANLRRLTVANVMQQLDHAMAYPSVRRAVDEGRLELVGMYFDIAEARLYSVDQRTGKLRPLDDHEPFSSKQVPA